MLILWIRKKKAEGQKNIKQQPEEINFQEHDDIMKRFRLAHPDVTSGRDFLTEEGNLLAPIEQVKLSSHSQN
jgi:hypothetical protein